MLRVDNVAHTFMSQTGPVDALGPVSFQVWDGSFVCLIGPSGCGKSTLLRIMAGLLAPTQGTVSLDGIAICEPQRRIGLVFQQSNLMPWRTVLDNLALPLELAGADRAHRRAHASASGCPASRSPNTSRRRGSRRSTTRASTRSHSPTSWP